MGGKSKSNQQTQQSSNETVTGIEPYQKQFAQDYGTLFNNFQALQNNRPQLQYVDNPMSNGFSSIVQNSMSQAAGALRGQQAQQDAATANALGVAGTGDNSALLNVLKRQGRMATAGALNQLQPAALQQQREMDIQNAALRDAQNKTKLAEYQAQLQGAQGGLGLLDQLQKMAATSAGRSSTATSNTQTQTKKSFF